MSPERWRLVKTIFQQALELEPQDRTAYLNTVCADDAELRSEVDSLLAYHTGAGQFLQTPATMPEAPLTDSPAPGDVLGTYRIVKRIGEGGMSVVYQGVRNDDEFQRLVAIKVLKRGMDTDFLVRRFRKERQILAQFDHPNVCKIFDGGSTPDGRPYFVMEYIAGQTIDRYCDEKKLSIRERLDLFLRICNGVEYAHQNLVVHRDLKPTNILVTEGGHPKLLDFGIAKVLEDERDITASYIRLMTPEYASPEQIVGGRITTRSDVYSLGVILFELLVGEKPYRLKGRSLEEARNAVATLPPRPSTVAGRANEKIAELRSTRRERLRRLLQDDLDNIVGMAMRKEPEERYSAVGQMAADIRRHFQGEPIFARKDSFGYRTKKFVQRHRVGVAATAGVIFALAAGVVVAAYNARVANQQRLLAERRFNSVRDLANTMLYEVHDAIVPLAGSTTARELIVRRAQQYLDSLSQDGGDGLERERAEAYLRIGDVLGNPALPNLGDVKAALSNYRNSLALNRALVAKSPQNTALTDTLATNLQRICAVQIRLGAFQDAMSSCSEAVALAEWVRARKPADAEALRALGIAYQQMTGPYFTLGEWDRAREFDEKALEVFETLAKQQPENDEWQMEIALSHHSLAQISEQAKQFEMGRSHAEKAVAGFEARAARHPNDSAAQFQPTAALQRLGSLRIALGDWKGALAAFERALPVRERLLAQDPKDARARLNLLRSHNSVGYALINLGDPRRALEHFQTEERLARELMEKDPNPVEHQTSIATAAEDIGSVWMYYARNSQGAESRGHWQRAREQFAKALQIASELNARGALRADYAAIMNRFKAEIATCDRALASRP